MSFEGVQSRCDGTAVPGFGECMPLLLVPVLLRTTDLEVDRVRWARGNVNVCCFLYTPLVLLMLEVLNSVPRPPRENVDGRLMVERPPSSCPPRADDTLLDT